MSEEEEREAYLKLCRAYYSTFHSPEGQIVFNDLLNLFYRRTSLDEHGGTNAVLANEGKRLVVIHILARMEEVSKEAEDKLKGAV